MGSPREHLHCGQSSILPPDHHSCSQQLRGSPLTVTPTLMGSFPATSWQMASYASSLLLSLNLLGASSSSAFLNSS